MLSYRAIERRVNALLQELPPELRTLPIPIKKITNTLGIELRYQPAENEISGALFRQEGRPIIAVNPAHQPSRRRFTIAHEIGHFRLHKAELFLDHDFAVDMPRSPAGNPRLELTARRDTTSSKATSEEEIEANRFAAALLMPREILTERLQDAQLPLRQTDIRELADQFEVSVEAMKYRLVNLSVPILMEP